jgi:DNA-binding response OmpR family regulator
MKILLVENEEELVDSITNHLKNDQFNIESALDIEDAESKRSNDKFNFFIIDENLPDGSGLEFMHQIKKEDPQSCVLMIAENNTTYCEMEHAMGICDDYLQKPFDLLELNVKINHLSRQCKLVPEEIVLNEIKIITHSDQVLIHNTDLKLTKKEYELFLFFFINRDKVITKQSLIGHLWGKYIEYEYPESTDMLHLQIRNLRKKISNASGKNYIKNISVMGYRFKLD